jgi:hypothetical protein
MPGTKRGPALVEMSGGVTIFEIKQKLMDLRELGVFFGRLRISADEATNSNPTVDRFAGCVRAIAGGLDDIEGSSWDLARRLDLE